MGGGVPDFTAAVPVRLARIVLRSSHTSSRVPGTLVCWGLSETRLLPQVCAGED